VIRAPSTLKKKGPVDDSINPKHCSSFCIKTNIWKELVSKFISQIIQSFTLLLCFIFFSTGAGTQGLHFEPLHQPFFCERFFSRWILWTICPGWLRTMILLISASWVARVTGVSHLRPALLWFWIFYSVATLKQSDFEITISMHKLNKEISVNLWFCKYVKYKQNVLYCLKLYLWKSTRTACYGFCVVQNPCSGPKQSSSACSLM
jgi:hypothetical protein